MSSKYPETYCGFPNPVRYLAFVIGLVCFFPAAMTVWRPRIDQFNGDPWDIVGTNLLLSVVVGVCAFIFFYNRKQVFWTLGLGLAFTLMLYAACLHGIPVSPDELKQGLPCYRMPSFFFGLGVFALTIGSMMEGELNPFKGEPEEPRRRKRSCGIFGCYR